MQKVSRRQSSITTARWSDDADSIQIGSARPCLLKARFETLDKLANRQGHGTKQSSRKLNDQQRVLRGFLSSQEQRASGITSQCRSHPGTRRRVWWLSVVVRDLKTLRGPLPSTLHSSKHAQTMAGESRSQTSPKMRDNKKTKHCSSACINTPGGPCTGTPPQLPLTFCQPQ